MKLLGRYLGVFTDKVEVGLDKVIERLVEGQRRAARLPSSIGLNPGLLPPVMVGIIDRR